MEKKQEAKSVIGVAYEVTLANGQKEFTARTLHLEEIPEQFLEMLTEKGINVLQKDLQRRKLHRQAELVNNLVFLMYATETIRNHPLSIGDRLSMIESVSAALNEIAALEGNF